MERKLFKYIIRHHFAIMEKALPGIKNYFDQDAIHQFRVQVKKLRATLRLLNIKLPGQLKNYYRSLGRVRDLQLQLTQLSNAGNGLHAPAEYLVALGKQLQEQKENCSFKKRQLAACRKKLLQKIPTLHRQQLLGYLHREMETLLLLSQQQNEADNYLHSCRKKIKDMVYLQDFYKESLRHHHQQGAIDSATYKKMALMADELGRYVDKWTAIDTLNNSHLNKLAPEKEEQLTAIRKQWQQELGQLADHAASSLHSPAFRSLLRPYLG
ncbi:MAG TPA: CHAD domain-containing protein [Chitinophagaceae bacterium]|nr:CHAD domain-containing protein [Chitinophagaceae bacterium]